ncbi:MAG: hypothetical protein ACLTQI_09080 [Slackia sp.]
MEVKTDVMFSARCPATRPKMDAETQDFDVVVVRWMGTNTAVRAGGSGSPLWRKLLISALT